MHRCTTSDLSSKILWRHGNDAKSSGGKADIICYNCHQQGHFARECPLEKKDCDFCHRRGHTEAECRSKLRQQHPHQSQQPSPTPSPSLYYHGELNMAHIDSASKEAIWLGDSGASHHTSYEIGNFTGFQKLATPYCIKQVQGHDIVTRCGTVALIVQSTTGPRLLPLTEVLYIPTMTFNLFSLQKVIKLGFIPVFGELSNKCIIKKHLHTGDMEQIALLSITNGRLTLECHLAPKTLSVPASPAIYVGDASMSLLHRRLGHNGQPAIKRLISKNMAKGFQGQAAEAFMAHRVWEPSKAIESNVAPAQGPAPSATSTTDPA